MNQLPKDVIVNVIIPKIVEDKNREIDSLKDIIAGLCDGKYNDSICGHNDCGKRIIWVDYCEEVKGEVKDIDNTFVSCNCMHVCNCMYACYKCELEYGLSTSCIGCGGTIKIYKAKLII